MKIYLSSLLSLFFCSFIYAQQPGDIDTTFGNSGIVTSTSFGSGNSVLIQPDDKIIVTAGSFGISRYMPNGAVDSTFGNNGVAIIPIGVNDLVNDATLQADGKIVTVGYSDNGSNVKDFTIIRLNNNGTLDTTFGNNGIVQLAFGNQEDQAKSVTVQPDGKIIVVGFSYTGTSNDIAIARLHPNGLLDSSFSDDGKLTVAVSNGNETANSVAVTANGTIYIGGTAFVTPSQYSSFVAIKLSASGSLATDFNGTGIVTTKIGAQNDTTSAILVQSDGKILLGGSSFLTTATKEEYAVLRLTSSGLLDTTFSTDGKHTIGFGGNDYGTCMALQVDGKIIIGGYVVTSQSKISLARITTAGTNDNTFSGDGKATIDINGATGTALAIQSSSRIVQVGYTSSGLLMGRFYGNPSCGSAAPSNLIAQNISSNSATISWEITGNQSPRYDYYYSLSPTVPNNTTAFQGSILDDTSTTIESLIPQTTYYFWVRSNCGDTRGSWISGGSFTTTPVVGCTNGTLFPESEFIPLCSGTFETITNIASSGEYSNVFCEANKNYSFRSSTSNDYLTVTNNDGTVVFGQGMMQVDWYSGAADQTVRFYIHSDEDCSTDNFQRSKMVRCESYNCSDPTSLSANTISAYGARLNWVVTTTPELGYDYFFNSTNIPPDENTIPSGTTINLTVDITGLTPQTTYYFWVRSKCNDAVLNNWVAGGNFITTAFNGCNSGIANLFMPFNFNCNGQFQNAGLLRAGYYNRANVVSNRTYTFSSSEGFDFITITNSTDNSVLAYGQSPLIWNNEDFSGIVRYYVHFNSNCGANDENRSITAKCDSFLCSTPTAIVASNISGTGVQMNWQSDTAPENGFDYYISTVSTIPTANTTPTGNTSNLYVGISGLTPTTTYYFWLRSVCASSFGNWILGANFSTTDFNGCNDGTLFPLETFTPSCNGNPEIISTASTAGNYANVTISAYRDYTFASDIDSDYITITTNDGLQTLAQGQGTAYFYSDSTETTVRVYIHSDPSCSTDLLARTIAVGCSSECVAPEESTISSITTTTAIATWQSTSTVIGYEIFYTATDEIPLTTTAATVSNITEATIQLENLVPSTNYRYWLRSLCGTANYSQWEYGGSFLTQSIGTSCNFGMLWPESIYTPSCSSEDEIIITDAFAGQYSLVNVTANKEYTFSSSVSTDFIQIFTVDGTTIAAGNTPLVWNCQYGGTIQYFIHTNIDCGIENIERIKSIKCSIQQCAAPISLTCSGSSASTISITWELPEANSIGQNYNYEYIISAANDFPIATTAPTGSFSTTQYSANLTPSNSSPSQTYFIWLRLSCGNNTKSNWVPFGGASTYSDVGCLNGTLYPPNFVFTPSCTGNNQTINTDAYASEYTLINIEPHTQYTFSTSVASDFVTITSGDGSSTFAYGPSPLVWNSALKSGIIRYYLNSDADCTTDSTNRNRYISCGYAPICDTNPEAALSEFSVSGITRNSAVVSWTASPIGLNYLYYISTSSIEPASAAVPMGYISVGTTQLNFYGLELGTTYNVWIRIECGANSNWFLAANFRTISGCTNGVLYPSATYTPSCSGNAELITPSAYAGEYSKVNYLPNNEYVFSSSAASDYITISNEDGSVIITDGPSPLVWNSGSTSGVLRYYLHTNNVTCGTQNTNRNRFISCGVSDCNVAAPITFDQSFCDGATVFDLIAEGENLKWYANSDDTTPMVLTDYLTSGTYYVSQTIANCESATRTEMNVTVFPIVVPQFAAIGSFCAGASIPNLPLISSNGIEGTWSPEINNNVTTEYTFTPNQGVCALPATLTIVINDAITVPELEDVLSCESFELPPLTNGTYYTAANGNGVTLNVGTAITQTSTIYIHEDNGQCQDESDFVVTIVNPDTTVTVENATLIAGQSGANYQWFLCGATPSLIEGATNQSYTAVANGDYAVVILLEDCTATSDCITIDWLHRNDIAVDNTITLFPNPTKEQFSVATGVSTAENISVFDHLGRLIVTRFPVGPVTEVNMDSFSDGIYYVKITIGNSSVTKKLILSR